MSRQSVWMLLLFITVCTAGCSLSGGEQGTLSGHVTIGPLVPVVREGEPEPTPSPEIYAAWQIVVFTADMGRELARVEIDDDGNYEITLVVGAYSVTAEPANGRGGPGGSEIYSVEIFPAQVTELDLDIDTGIR